MEERIFIKSEPEVELETLVKKAPGNKAVVIVHPHPLYGGSMYNNVVEAVADAYYEMGYTTVRFNFRGVGESTGTYDDGVGEAKDVKAVFNYVRKRLRKEEIAISGYSFGAWVVASSMREINNVDHVVLISAPVSMIDFSFLKEEPRIKLVITGSYDYIAPEETIKKLLPLWNQDAKLYVIDGADHFYWGYEDRIKKIIKNFLKNKNGF